MEVPASLPRPLKRLRAGVQHLVNTSVQEVQLSAQGRAYLVSLLCHWKSCQGATTIVPPVAMAVGCACVEPGLPHHLSLTSIQMLSLMTEMRLFLLPARVHQRRSHQFGLVPSLL